MDVGWSRRACHVGGEPDPADSQIEGSLQRLLAPSGLSQDKSALKGRDDPGGQLGHIGLGVELSAILHPPEPRRQVRLPGLERMIELGPHGAGLLCQLTHQRPERAPARTVAPAVRLDDVISPLLQIHQRPQTREQRALPGEHCSDLELHDSIDQRFLGREVATDLRAADPRRDPDPLDAHPCDAEPDNELGSAPDNPVPRRRIPAGPPRGWFLEFLSGHAQMLANPN